MKPTKDVKISACMMVKNEEEMLPRCLKSIAHLMDEIIVVDTGSTDKTVEIAESFGAKIYHHPWENDFSKHRNQSISYVTGDWFLIIDADEELNAYDVEKKNLKKILGHANDEINCFLIKVLDKNTDGTIASATDSARFFRNYVGVEYRGIVHNTAYYPGNASTMGLSLTHYGYALSPEQMRAKHKRTSSLLFKRIEQDPSDFNAYFYLFQVHMEMKDIRNAEKYANQCLDLLSETELPFEEASFYYALYHGLANAYLRTKQFEKVEPVIRKGLCALPDEVDLYYDLAALGYFTKSADLAIEGGQNYLRVVDEFRGNSLRAGTRFVFTTDKDGELSVCVWLMLGLIWSGNVKEFLEVWEKRKGEFIDQALFQRKILAALEEKKLLDGTEAVARYLFENIDKIPEENKLSILFSLLFVLKLRQSLKGDVVESLFENVAVTYLESVESYDVIPSDCMILLADYLHQKNISKFFLDITFVLFNRELSGKIKVLDSDEVIANGYRQIQKGLGGDQKGRLLGSLCRDIADRLAPRGLVAQAHAFKTAFLEYNISPRVSDDQPVAVQGMAGGARLATKVERLLKMQLMLIEDENGTKLLMVSADLFGFGNPMVQIVRTAAEEWGIPPEGIILNASHTHYAPGTVAHASQTLGAYYQQYAEDIARLIVSSLDELYERLEPSEVYCGYIDGLDIGINRRKEENGQIRFEPNEKGEYDRQAPFLLVEQGNEKTRILMINHGCHPTGFGNAAVISPDFPGYLREQLVKDGEVNHVMYLQGAAGNIKERSPLVPGKSGPAFASTIQDAMVNAENAAGIILSSLGASAFERLDVSSICCKKEVMLLPLKQLPDLTQIRTLAENPKTDPVIREWAGRLIKSYPSGQFPNALSLDVQVVVLGKKVPFVTFPAEPVSELGQKIKKLARFPENTFVLGYTNGLVCYLPDDKIILEGGYESDVSPYFYMIPYLLAQGTEERVLSSVRNAWEMLEQEKKGNGSYGTYHHARNTPGPAIFTLSAGRCGTQTLASILDLATNAKVWHHPRPFLINETYQAYRDRENIEERRRVFWRGRGQFLYKTWAQGLIHGETDHNMTPFCDVIAEDIPDSKFIVLVRNPWDFVRSGMRRNYYNGHAWDSGRLRPSQRDEGFAAWSNMSQFEKVCWLWNETYSHILNHVEKLDKDRIYFLKFEDMINVKKSFMNFASGLGLAGLTLANINSVLGKRLNAQSVGSFSMPEDWTPVMKRQLWDICGETADRFGYTPKYPKKEKIIIGTKSCTSQNPTPEIITIWDFKKFPHQKYPDDNLGIQYFMKNTCKIPLIGKDTPITSMGSCFARNIATYLIQNQYNYLVTEFPFQQASAHWDQVFNTACMRQIFEYTFFDGWMPQTRWWPKQDMVQDPFRRQILYPKNSCEKKFQKHRQASYNALTKAKVIILTLGLIETWRDKRDGMTYYRVPSPELYDPQIHEFHIQSVDECTMDLECVYKILKQHNPEASIVVTVSPVPLFATFRQDVDPITANMFSKATLRVAAEQFVNNYDNVDYFPSYEIITGVMENAYESDNRHIRKESITEMMEIFRTWFMFE